MWRMKNFLSLENEGKKFKPCRLDLLQTLGLNVGMKGLAYTIPFSFVHYTEM